MDIPNKPEIKLDPDPFNVNEWTEKIVRQVNETEDEFIFTTIKPFIDSVATMEISKKELIEAIQWVRWNKECSEKYGYSIDKDWHTAQGQVQGLREAYNRGFKNGYCKATSALKETIDEMNKGE